jgi:hypothetical protein
VEGFFISEKTMIEISYANVLNGLDKGIHMSLVCRDFNQTDYIFRNAVELWHIQGFTKIMKHEIMYGDVMMRFRNINSMHDSSFRGFRGVFLIHPSLLGLGLKFSINERVHELQHHNERYLESWRD